VTDDDKNIISLDHRRFDAEFEVLCRASRHLERLLVAALKSWLCEVKENADYRFDDDTLAFVLLYGAGGFVRLWAKMIADSGTGTARDTRDFAVRLKALIDDEIGEGT
jgi:hypothetical protein